MLAVDWSNVKGFAVYDGNKAFMVETLDNLLDLAKGQDVITEESIPKLQQYNLTKVANLYLIPNDAVIRLREEKGLGKHKRGIEDDLLDAQLIYEYAQNGGKKSESHLDESKLELINMYYRFLYIQKHRQRVDNILRGIEMNFGRTTTESISAYLFDKLKELAKEYRVGEDALKEKIENLAFEPPRELGEIRGFSKWMWAGILATADPRIFPSKQAYRKYIGRVNKKNIDYKFSRKASHTYRIIAESLETWRAPYWRDLYDSEKERLSNNGCSHPHGAALNRVGTKFANYVYDVVNKGDKVLLKREFYQQGVKGKLERGSDRNKSSKEFSSTAYPSLGYQPTLPDILS